MDWWNDDYVYRRSFLLNSNDSDVPAMHPVTVLLPESVWANNKVIQGNLEDLEVVYSVELDNSAIFRSIIHNDDGIYVTFQSQDTISKSSNIDSYSIYYGNPTLSNQPARAEIIYNPSLDRDISGSYLPNIPTWSRWPLAIPGSSSKIGYTRPGEHWINGESSTTNARATFNFHGDRVRLMSRVGPDGGIGRVKLNGGEWTEIDLFEETNSVRSVVSYLDIDDIDIENEITVEVVGASRYGSGSHKINIDSFQYANSIEVVTPSEEIKELQWQSYIGGV